MENTDSGTSPETSAQASRPRAVQIALVLLWTYLLLYALVAGNELMNVPNAGPAAWAVPLVTIAIVAALIGFVARGSNAARYVYVALFVLGSLPLALYPGALFARSQLIGSLNILMFALQLAAIVLLFSPRSARWFKRTTSA